LAIIVRNTIEYLEKKHNILKYNQNFAHKEKFKNKIFVTGGLSIFITFTSLNFLYNFEINYLILIYLILIFILGLMSDLNFRISATIRFLIILILSIFIIYLNKLNFLDLKFKYVNQILNTYPLISILFTALCLSVLINGSNLIDGTHGLVTLFYVATTINLLIYYNFFLFYSDLNNKLLISLIPILTLTTLLNFREKIFLGDSGSYFIGGLMGILIITSYMKLKNSNPYYYANLLFYPGLEVLFSIIRKFIIYKNPFKPDKKHLHHLIFNQYKKKNNLQSSKIKTTLTIICFIIIFQFLALFLNSSMLLIFNIFIFTSIYTLGYIYLIRAK
jgi:UDP-N-acetylmuramyl pentapeptide phosphotransferase/UDP-N-acetylglucosamine-1-phosphate transferase